MNRQIKIDRNFKILLVIDFLMLILIFISKFLYTNLGYYYLLIDISLVINIVLLLALTAITIISIINRKIGNKLIIIVLSLFAVGILFNTVFMIVLNKPIEKKYKIISKRLISYCEENSCNTFKTEYLKDERKLIIEKTFFDYDNNENQMTIETLYNKNEVINTNIYIYSDNSLFSEKLIAEEVNNYLSMFDKKASEDKILQAFNNRFNGAIKDGKTKYLVEEIYDKNGSLTKLRVTISLNLLN